MAKLSWDDLKAGEPGAFRPAPHYDADSDTLSLYIAPDESFGERIDKHLTVYRSLDTNQVVGCQIKHVRKILSTVSTFNLGIQSADITIGLLLMGLRWVDGEDPVVATAHYREIVEPISQILGDQPIETH